MLEQTKCFSLAIEESERLIAQLDTQILPSEERQRLEKLKVKRMALEKILSDSNPNTAGIDFKPGEVITENEEVYIRVLAKLELITEGVKQINQELRGLITKPRSATTDA